MAKDTGKYKSYSFRLHPETFKKLQELKEKEDISWNKFIYKIIKGGK